MAKATGPTNDATNSLGYSNYFESPRHSDVSEVSQENTSLPDPSRSEASSGLLSSDENRRLTRNKKESYTVPKASVEEMKQMPKSKRLWTKCLLQPTPTRIQRGLRLRYKLVS